MQLSIDLDKLYISSCSAGALYRQRMILTCSFLLNDSCREMLDKESVWKKAHFYIRGNYLLCTSLFEGRFKIWHLKKEVTLALYRFISKHWRVQLVFVPICLIRIALCWYYLLFNGNMYSKGADLQMLTHP